MLFSFTDGFLVIDLDALKRDLQVIDDYELGRGKWAGREPNPYEEKPEDYRRARWRVRDLGEAAHEANGFEAMQQAARSASTVFPNALNTLNAAWNGIGEWKS